MRTTRHATRGRGRSTSIARTCSARELSARKDDPSTATDVTGPGRSRRLEGIRRKGAKESCVPWGEPCRTAAREGKGELYAAYRDPCRRHVDLRSGLEWWERAGGGLRPWRVLDAVRRRLGVDRRRLRHGERLLRQRRIGHRDASKRTDDLAGLRLGLHRDVQRVGL